MLTDQEAPAAPPQQWSWKKILLGLLGIFTIFLIALLAYDTELEPYDDLKPARREIPNAATNGYLFLAQRWEKLPDLSRQDQARVVEMIQGSSPWDPALLETVRKGREQVAADLTTALAKKEWLVPPTLSYSQLMAEDSPTWIVKPCRYLRLEAVAAARNGDFPTALLLLQQMRQLSARQIAAQGNLISFLVAVSLQSQAAELCCDLLEQGRPEASQIQGMAALWEDEPAAREAGNLAIRGEVAFMSDFVQQMKAGNLPEAAWYSGLLLKKNQTLNRYHRRMRNLMEVSFEVFPSLDAAKMAGLEARPDRRFLGKILNPNFQGIQLTEGAESYVSVIKSLRRVLFIPRAMRVRLALHRWRADHPDQWPATLDELVPDYLDAVPSDPWNGKPLMWDAATLTIYAVGADWAGDLPKFDPARRSWFAEDNDSPGIRLKLPPPPAPARAPLRLPGKPLLLSPKKPPQIAN